MHFTVRNESIVWRFWLFISRQPRWSGTVLAPQPISLSPRRPSLNYLLVRTRCCAHFGWCESTKTGCYIFKWRGRWRFLCASAWAQGEWKLWGFPLLTGVGFFVLFCFDFWFRVSSWASKIFTLISSGVYSQLYSHDINKLTRLENAAASLILFFFKFFQCANIIIVHCYLY